MWSAQVMYIVEFSSRHWQSTKPAGQVRITAEGENTVNEPCVPIHTAGYFILKQFLQQQQYQAPKPHTSPFAQKVRLPSERGGGKENKLEGRPWAPAKYFIKRKLVLHVFSLKPPKGRICQGMSTYLGASSNTTIPPTLRDGLTRASSGAEAE